MILEVRAGEGYDIVMERGALAKAGELLSLDRRVLIVTDSGTPKRYADEAAAQCKSPHTVVLEQGEGSKSMDNFALLLRTLLREGFTREDAVIAVGGGMVGDIAGFAAASYMRGIDFYNIPTTVLSQVDSSIGGKTAINLDGVKNIVGAFYQPKRVIIDTALLGTLSQRQINNGLAESVKMALTSNGALFELIESGDVYENMDAVIESSIRIKRSVVEQDEREHGLRRILNFGHTIGHGIESFEKLNGLYHGECVALGMLPVCGEGVRQRVKGVLEKLSLPTSLSFDREAVYSAMLHDKKLSHNGLITLTFVNGIGSFELKKLPVTGLYEMLSIILREEGR